MKLMQQANLEIPYQCVVAIQDLASVYHNASVEKVDHVFFNGNKITFKPELITLLKTRRCNEEISNSEWSRLLTDMGYDPEQINDFDSIELIPGQTTLKEELRMHALHFPQQSVYAAMDAILKNYNHDPMFEILSTSFQISEEQVRGLFGIAYHYLDTMHPLETELNLLTDFYEPYFDHSRDKRMYAQSAKILGQIERELETLPSSIAEAANQYVLLRSRQLRQYAHLDISKPVIAASLQTFHAKLRSELAVLKDQNSPKSNLEDRKQLLLAMTKPEIEWLENTITKLEMSENTNERQKGAKIQAVYLSIPCEQRDLIITEMQKPGLNPASPIGQLKAALDLSTAAFPMFDTLLNDQRPYHLSQDFKERYRISLEKQNIDDTKTDSDSDKSEPLSPV